MVVKKMRKKGASKASVGAGFLPASREEMDALGWERCDVILVSGDACIDSPFIGVAVVGRVLERAGYRVGVIGQPEVDSGADIARLGEPRLFWGVSGGCVDSMVSNYTATRKFRNQDDYTPGGKNDKRPDRATLVYSNLIRRHFKNTVPIVLGGIEASLRRVTHYDYWSNKLRKPVLFDAKADYLVYGMGEKAAVALASALERGDDPRAVRGICYIAKEPVEGYIRLPAHAEAVADKGKYIDLFDAFYENNDPISASGLCQQVDNRYLIQNPPAEYLTTQEMDAVAALPFTRELHPLHRARGPVKCLETIKFSIATHRGCWGDCSFCAIGVHEGRTVRCRSEASIAREAETFTRYEDFSGIISDVGGPTANMYGYECEKKLEKGTCARKRCVDAKRLCKLMPVDHRPNTGMLKRVRGVEGVRKAFVASGVRYDLVIADSKHGRAYLEELVRHHVSGQLKVAPEHSEEHVLELMGKPNKQTLVDFKSMFDRLNRRAGLKQFLTYYLIAAHPGCRAGDMQALKRFAAQELKMNPEQVQVFTPTPGTCSSVMYYTGMDPRTRRKIFVERDSRRKEQQKEIVTRKPNPRRARS